MSTIVRHVAESIGAASVAHAEAAREHVAGAGAAMLERLAYALGAAQHAPRPRAQRRLIVVVAGDHGAGDPGIAMGADHPTIVAAHAIAAGTAALSQVARSSRTPVVLIDAGAREARHMPVSAIALGRGPSTDLMRGPAMSIVDAYLGLEAGIALSISLSEPVSAGHGDPVPDTSAGTGHGDPAPDTSAGTGHGDPAPDMLSVLALGAIGVGAEVASAALLGAVTGRAPTGLGDAQAELAGKRGAELARQHGLVEPRRADLAAPRTAELARLHGAELAGVEHSTERNAMGTGARSAERRVAHEPVAHTVLSGVELLAAFGGAETAVLAGLMLGAASMNVPVILDSYATGAAALVAAAIAPAITGYLIAAHRGGFTHPAILAHLGLVPVFDVGLGHGEGTGAAMVLPLVDQVASLVG